MRESSRPDGAVEDLVRRAQRGDREAFDDLARRCHHQVYRWALVQMGDPDDADDVAQEVLVRLYTRLRSYAGKSQFSTWLYQVTRNTALAVGRKRARRSRLLRIGKIDPEEDVVVEDQLERIHAAGLMDLIRTLFERLPGRQREVFHLADLQGHSPTEIGKMLGMNPVTVRANLCKARRAIRAEILERHPEMAEGITP